MIWGGGVKFNQTILWLIFNLPLSSSHEFWWWNTEFKLKSPLLPHMTDSKVMHVRLIQRTMKICDRYNKQRLLILILHV
jgi:hypothetical protein